MARCTGRAPPRIRSSSFASGSIRWSASGAGYSSWLHLDDAASATVLAVEQRAKGVFNIVDDEPAPATSGCPTSPACAGAKPPMRVPTWLARTLAGEVAVDHDDRGSRVLEREGETGARLGAALPVLAAGFRGGAGMTRADEFDDLRPLLFAIAYRILGSVSEAEDAVQETWLRYAGRRRPPDVDQGVPVGDRHPGLDRRTAFGARAPGGVRRHLVPRAAGRPTRTRTRRARQNSPTRCRWPRCCCSSSSRPLERAVFVLREVFAFDFPEIASSGRTVGGRLPPARGARPTPHGRRPPALRGGPPRAGRARGPVPRGHPRGRCGRAHRTARRRRPDGRRRRGQGAAVGQGRVRRREGRACALLDDAAVLPDRRNARAAQR